MRRLLIPLLFLGGGALGLAQDRDSEDLLRGLNSPWVSGWTVADFDGDNLADVATASAGKADEQRGYAQEVSVSFSKVQKSSFKFRSQNAKVQLRARDLDGDADRDIVVLDASSLEPIGVWLNDGAGHFQEGDLADFQNALNQTNRNSFDSLALPAPAFLAISEQRTQAALSSVSVAPRDRMTEAVAAEREARLTVFQRSDLRSRAPPRTS